MRCMRERFRIWRMFRLIGCDTRWWMMRSGFFRSFSLFLFAGLTVRAQVGSATLAGTVTDQSAAIVSDAKVTAMQSSTGFSRSAITDTRGNYVFDALAPGSYTISVVKPGFRVYEA